MNWQKCQREFHRVDDRDEALLANSRRKGNLEPNHHESIRRENHLPEGLRFTICRAGMMVENRLEQAIAGVLSSGLPRLVVMDPRSEPGHERRSAANRSLALPHGSTGEETSQLEPDPQSKQLSRSYATRR